MKLRRIEVRRMPGMGEAFTVRNLSDGINIVLGPNGSGKSSICKAVRATLWPERGIPGPAEVNTTWLRGGVDYHATLADGVRWQREGVVTEPPPLPDADLADCYTIGLTDLFETEGETDRGLASRVRIHMAGGYDLDSVIDYFHIKRRAGEKEWKTLGEALKRLRRLEGERRELADRGDRISQLEGDRNRALRASGEIDKLKGALEFADLREKQTEIEARLLLYPDKMDLVRGDELESIEALEDDLREAANELARIEETRTKSETLLTRECLPHGPVDDGEVNSFRARLREADQLRNRLDDLTREREGAKSILEKCVRDMSGSGDPDALESEAADLLDKADRLISRASRVRENRKSCEAKLAVLEHTDNEDPPGCESEEGIAPALTALQEWLASPPPAKGGRVHPVIMIVLALAAAGSGAAAFLFHPFWAALAGAAAGILAILLLPHRFANKNRRQELEERYLTIGCSPPGEWAEETVRERIAELQTGQIRIERRRQRQAERESIHGYLETIAVEELEIEQSRGEILGETGGDASAISDLRLDDLARTVATWRETSRHVAGLSGKLEKTQSDYETRLAAITDFIKNNLGEAPEDVAAAFENLEELKERSELLRREEENRDQADLALPKIRATIKKLEDRIQAVFARFALEETTRDGGKKHLAERIEKLDHFSGKQADLADVKSRISGVRARLEGRGDLLTMNRDDLMVQLAEAETEAMRQSEIAEEIGAIRNEIERAKDSTDLEEANAEVGRAREDLNDRGEELLRKAASSFLLDRLREEYEENAKPAVLKRASRLFSQFTHQSYELRVNMGNEGNTFHALDSSSREGVELGALSDATRAQLLLAARLSFAVGEDGDEQPPLFLDEALSTTDPNRFRAVAESVLQLCRDGRQAFYMTSNPSDARYWEEIAAPLGMVIQVVDLAEIRHLDRAPLPPGSLDTPPPPLIPHPGDKSPQEYAEAIGVTPPDPFAPVESAHLLFLLRDRLELLHQLLSAGLSTVGQWTTLVRNGGARTVTTVEEGELIESRRELAAAYLDAWRVGRNRPFGREILARSEAVSGTWLSKIASLLDECGGDGARLLLELREKRDSRAKGFREAKTAELEGWLIENHYIDERERLDDGEIRALLLAAAAPRMEKGTASPAGVNRQADEWRTVLQFRADQVV